MSDIAYANKTMAIVKRLRQCVKMNQDAEV